MKKIFLTLFAVFSLLACEGPVGPPGPPGQSEGGLLGTVFEIENVDFNAGNEYSFLGVFNDFVPADMIVLSSDIVLVYLLETTTQNGDDVWSLMPQTFYLSGGGIVQYNFNHTLQDFEIYLHGNGDLNALGPEFTQNQIFRVVILPADYAQTMQVDITDYQAVMTSLKIQNPTFEIQRIEK